MKIIDCPRDAMQGFKAQIPTQAKIDFINAILRVGFDTVDFGSFVSPKAIPQMADTKEVLKGLHMDSTKSKLLAIVANERGVEEAAQFDEISYLGFPFSVSEEFQRRNANKTIEESLATVDHLMKKCVQSGKTPVIYLSMGFGNPYGEHWHPDLVAQWTEKLVHMGAGIIAPSDTIGAATPESISAIFSTLIPAFPQVEFGAHLHSTYESWAPKIDAAWNAGCRRFDGAIKGYGGCPMAKDELVGNMPTEKLLSFAASVHEAEPYNMLAFEYAYNVAMHVFS
jgi:hydroxymethylglutaryl-CoA lyase